MTFSFIFLVNSLLLALTVSSVLGDNPPFTCGTGLQICNDFTLGQVCYDPTIASCVPSTVGLVLCGFQEHGPDGACGTICYDMVDYVCCNNQIYGVNDTHPCSSNPASACPPLGSAPTAIPNCPAENLICNDARLGPTCYDPTINSCPSGTCGTILCGFQEHGPDGACGTICYDMVDYVCCNNAIYGVNDTNHPCAATIATPPASSCPASAPTAVPNCPSGNQICNDATMGPTCYDPTIYSCPSGTCGDVLCGFQEHGPDGACGTICYDMVEYLCCNNQLYGVNDPAAAQACSGVSAPTSAPSVAPTIPATSAPSVAATSAPTSAATSSPTSSPTSASSGGITNPNNPSGPDGASNPSGPNGPSGADNPSGPNGANNPSGPNGASNPSGPDNKNNPSGPDHKDNPNH